jgi:hypothetical protein
MRIPRPLRATIAASAVVGVVIACEVTPAGAEVADSTPTAAAAVTSVIGSPQVLAMQTARDAPSISFRVAGGARMQVASHIYDRQEVAPLVSDVSSLPHGSELSKLKLYAGTEQEVTALCGEGTMACYDPVSERMVISGQEEEIDGISRESVIAHEYGHHIANNRAAGIWPAFDQGTLRWSTFEHVCERHREGLAFPGNEGAHYWENPGEAFAQSYSQLVDPQTTWNYSPLFAPNETSLRKLREDVLDPVEPKHTTWQFGDVAGSTSKIGEAVPLTSSGLSQELKVPYDGRVRVRLRAARGAYRLALIDPASGKTVAEASPGSGGVTRLRYADCGERSLRLVSTPVGSADKPFVAHIIVP